MPHCCPSHALDEAGNMAGIPDWLYYTSIIVIMAISFAVFEFFRKGKEKEISKKTFMVPLGDSFFRSRLIQFVFQSVLVILFGLIIVSGFYGNQQAGENIAPVLTWNIWWIGLIIIVLFLGKLWCYACPWDAVTSWLSRLSFFKVKKNTLNLGWKWPKKYRNIYLATALFILLTWIELGYHVTYNPAATALLGLVMFGIVFIPGLLFEKKSFCRYGCLIGRISGLYSLFSPVEIRAKDKSVCNSCTTADCLKGNGKGYECPTGQYLKTMDRNTYCTMCGECFRSCPHKNVSFNVRPFAYDLLSIDKPRRDEAFLALVLFALTAFHGFTMTPGWRMPVLSTIKNITLFNFRGVFSIGMALCLIAPILVYALFVWFAHKINVIEKKSYMELFIRHAYGLIPIALFYHIAHNLEHFLMEGQYLIILASDPFGWNWDLFGTANLQLPPFVSLNIIWFIQVIMIITGHVFGIYVSHTHAYSLYNDRGEAIRSQVPMIVLMVLFSLLSLWLVAQPMDMRTAM